jgi:hypothetical protein
MVYGVFNVKGEATDLRVYYAFQHIDSVTNLPWAVIDKLGRSKLLHITKVEEERWDEVEVRKQKVKQDMIKNQLENEHLVLLTTPSRRTVQATSKSHLRPFYCLIFANSLEQSLDWDANSRSANQGISHTFIEH